MRNKGLLTNIDNSDLVNYPAGRIKNNTGSGNGTPVNEIVYGDIHEAKDKLMRRYGIDYNNLPDNETNGYQYIDALMALPTKNDFVLTLGTASGKLTVNLKLNRLEENECFILKANVDKTTETLIVGSDSTPKPIVFVGDFKAGEYVRMVFTSANVYLVRLVDATNLNIAVNELLYLKKATQVEEDAGLIETAATTPKSNLTAFIKRVIGGDSVNYLANALRNGLYPKEHFSIVAGLGVSPVRNFGTVSGINIDSGSIGTTYPVTGNIVSATLTDKPTNASTIRIVLQNTMTDMNYYVRSYIQSNSALIGNDNAVGSVVFKQINPTTFDISIQEYQSQPQNLKVYFEVVKI